MTKLIKVIKLIVQSAAIWFLVRDESQRPAVRFVELMLCLWISDWLEGVIVTKLPKSKTHPF